MSTTNSPLFIETVVPDGKGLGLVATQPIPSQTYLLDELPYLWLDQHAHPGGYTTRNFMEAIRGLSPANLAHFRTLRNAYKADKCCREVGIFKTNAVQYWRGMKGRGLYALASRVNHSCRANANLVFYEDGGENRMKLLTTRDILKGEEITTAYDHTFLSFEKRQRRLYGKYGFWCKCEYCKLEGEARKQSDEALDFVGKVLAEGPGTEKEDPKTTLQSYRKAAERLERQGILGDALVAVYASAWRVAMRHSDKARAFVFATRWLMVTEALEGDCWRESAFWHEIAVNPQRRTGWAMYGDAWGTTTYDDERNWMEVVGSPKFESWLWRSWGYHPPPPSCPPPPGLACGFRVGFYATPCACIWPLELALSFGAGRSPTTGPSGVSPGSGTPGTISEAVPPPPPHPPLFPPYPSPPSLSPPSPPAPPLSSDRPGPKCNGPYYGRPIGGKFKPGSTVDEWKPPPKEPCRRSKRLCPSNGCPPDAGGSS